jgi:2-octaprenyl-6-methoxyphenol hydroxylase
VRPVLLTFAGDIDRSERDAPGEGDAPGEAFAHMVPNTALVRALEARAEALGVRVLRGARVQDYVRTGSRIEVSLAGGPEIGARLLVGADGARSRVREIAGIRTVSWEYGQWALVATVAHERPHGGRAEEHFLPSGPFATLPLRGNRASIVWTEREADAKRIMALDDAAFLEALERRFGYRLGRLELVGGRGAFPLRLMIARDFVAERVALAGDSAHVIHPIAGQGLNMGLKDVAALAEIVVETARLGLDIGALDRLRLYERWRRFDTVAMGATTDVLNRLFSNDVTPIRMVRDFGLGLVDRMPVLKRFFIREAAGFLGDTPRLLRGEAL